MKLLLLKGALTLMLVKMSFLSFGQTVSQQLNSEEITNRVAYVHGNDYVINNPTLVSAFGDVMMNRIEYQVSPLGQTEKYPLLSSMPLMDKVNQTIQGANFSNFDVNTFNPLVYNLEFFSDKTQVMRIDNTNYIMVIKPIIRN
jgi:hypothetical protein